MEEKKDSQQSLLHIDCKMNKMKLYFFYILSSSNDFSCTTLKLILHSVYFFQLLVQI